MDNLWEILENTKMNEVDKLKHELLSKESEKILDAAKKLSELGIDTVKEILIPLLERKEP